jgi:hypothetical protein
MIRDDVEKVESVEDCIDTATVDANGEEEQLMGWEACLVDVLSDINEVEFLGNIVQFTGLQMKGQYLLACVESDKRKALIDISSIEFKDLAPHQELWVEAWSKWL